jgi:two-component system, OmpR family, response regulator RegX3
MMVIRSCINTSPLAKNLSIALLEDDELIVEILDQTIHSAGWTYTHFKTIAAISAALKTQNFDLLLLDWSLPDGEADQVIRMAREELALNTPILVESIRNDESSIVAALLLGADDYIVKPLRISELRARITALFRRSHSVESNLFTLGPYQIDKINKEIFLNQELLPLTSLEYELGCYILKHPGALLSREQLLIDVWRRNPKVTTRTVDIFVSRLRKKLKLDLNTGMQLSTLRGYGYRLETDV